MDEFDSSFGGNQAIVQRSLCPMCDAPRRPARAAPSRRDRVNLIARIVEAEREGWLGEVDGLSVSLAAAEDKLAQLDVEVARRSTVVQLGLPTFGQIATRTTEPS
ncbi:hypothetical protein AB0O07_33660 [Streptomyces sp. NPDC093085]|uniref:hypothetical protein n=1 Tax=Streptomyces sp. NPDC093085 TaxID=3155068 RepID=UPI00343DC499